MPAIKTISFGVILAMSAGTVTTPAYAQDMQNGTGGATSGETSLTGEITEMVDLSSEGELKLVAASEFNDLEALVGARAYDLNDERVGEISDMGVGGSGEKEIVVLDVGGFLGIGEKPVAVEMSEIEVALTVEGKVDHVVVAKTMDELEALPEFRS